MTANLPEAFINRIRTRLGDETEAFIDSYNNESVKSLRINTLKGDKERLFESKILEDELTEVDITQNIPWCPDGFYYTESDNCQPGKSPLHAAGAYYIQEASAMSPVEELNVVPGDRVLDLCASPGGKSTQIAAKLKGEGILFTNEPEPKRARILSENIERMGVANAIVINHFPQEISDRFEGYFNKILVDAPCSGEGMFRKNPEAVTEWSPDNVIMCANRQKEIIDEAVKMLAPGGRLVFSTCTFSEEENEGTVDYIISKFSDMRHIKSNRLWPHRERGEGHFYAVFEKGGMLDSSPLDEIYCPLGYEKAIKANEVKSYTNFADEIFLHQITDGNHQFKLFGDELYLIPVGTPSLKGLKVLRCGLHLGTLKKDRFEPNHSLALAIDPENVKNHTELTRDEAIRFMHGETICRDNIKGWCLMCYHGYSIGWGKASSQVVKNHYPKGLRINY